MFLRILVCILAAVLVFTMGDQTFDPINPKLKFVANVDGKSYFADSTPRNWTAAGDYCRSLGMELATITSKNQAEALDAAYHSTDFAGDHWTSGRDAQLIRQFSWNVTGQELSAGYLKLINQNEVSYQTCTLYISLPGNNTSGLGYWSCIGSFHVLCET